MQLCPRKQNNKALNLPHKLLLLLDPRMFKKVFLLILVCVGTVVLSAKAQQLPIVADSLQNYKIYADSLDSASLVVEVPDTITPKLLKPLDSVALSQIVDSLNKGFGFPPLNFEELNKNFQRNSINSGTFQQGSMLPKGENWVLAFVAFLLVLFAVLKQTFSKQLGIIILSFFSNRVLGNLNKEDNLFTSWPFLLLFIQFGFTIGMFFYLVGKVQNQHFVADGFQSYVTISVVIIVLYVFKILLLRMLGFVFNILKPVNEYVSILYLSYFNSSLLFIPLVVAFALSPLEYSNLYMAVAIVLVAIIFIFQFIRAAINILSHYRFSKVYLILYFCTLEICPILILIKTIGF